MKGISIDKDFNAVIAYWCEQISTEVIRTEKIQLASQQQLNRNFDNLRNKSNFNHFLYQDLTNNIFRFGF